MAAGPGGRPVGRVSVRVVPDTSTFASSLEAYLQRLEHRLKVEIPVGLNQATVAATEARLALLARNRTVKLDVDSAGISRLSSALSAGGGGGRGFGLWGLITNPYVIAGGIAAVGVAIAGLPGLLASVAAPLGAIALGFEGIKRSAAGLKTPFEQLRASVSATFEQGLTPSMEKLKTLFPTLTDGFNKIAESLSRMFEGAVKKLTSPEGLAMLDNIFTNISKALDALAPAMGPFVDSLLLLGESGTESFAKFAPVLADLFVKFNDLLNMMDRVGLLDLAMDGLGAAITAVVAALGAVVIAGTLASAGVGAFAAQFTRSKDIIVAGNESIIAKIQELGPRIQPGLAAMGAQIRSQLTTAWNNAKSATTAGVNAVVNFVRPLRGRIVAALAALPGQLKSLATRAWNSFFGEVKRIGGAILNWVSSWASKIASAVSGALSMFSPSKVMMKLGKNTMEGFRIGIEDYAQGPLDAARNAASAIAGIRAPSTTVVDETGGGRPSEADAIGRAVAKYLIGGTFKMDDRGNLQLIAAGG